jgi:cytidylate kinase
VPEELLAVERQIIETVAGRGQAVIVGRGAAHLLRGRSGVLKVFLHAPSAPRIELAMGEYGLPNRGEAERIVRINDADRARFVRSLTGRDWCDATLYDITLDTSITGFEKAANAIIALVQP